MSDLKKRFSLDYLVSAKSPSAFQKFLDSKYRIEWHRMGGMKEGWDACKQEILKILKDHPNLNEKTSLDKALEKIKSL